jgi:thymidine kinase
MKKLSNIYFYYGSSAFGKSTFVIESYYKYKKLGYKPLVVYCPSCGDPQVDIYSRDLGTLKSSINPIIITRDVLDTIPWRNSDVFIFDEIQNKSQEEIDILIKYACDMDKTCIFVGALYDPYGRKIITTEYLSNLDINCYPLEVCCDIEGCNNQAFTSINIGEDNRIVMNPANYDKDLKTLRVCKDCHKKYVLKDYNNRMKEFRIS